LTETRLSLLLAHHLWELGLSLHLELSMICLLCEIV
jgi:hypothetical protein